MRLESILARRLPVLLAVCFGIVALNLLVYFTAVSRLDRFTRTTKQKSEANRTRLQELEKRGQRLTGDVEAVKQDRLVADKLAADVFQTRARRLVAFQTALQDLVQKNQLSTENLAYSYAAVPPEGDATWGRRYLKMQMQLPLKGTYPQVKSLLMDLDRSPEFIVVNSLTLGKGSQSSAVLSVNLGLSTYFVASDADLMAAEKGKAS